MKNFEMPKMNISIFSEENIVTESNGTAAKKLLESTEGMGAVTYTTINNWEEWNNL